MLCPGLQRIWNQPRNRNNQNVQCGLCWGKKQIEAHGKSRYSESTLTVKNEAQQIVTVPLSIVDSTHDTPAEVEELEAAAEPSVRQLDQQMNTTKRRFSYLAKADTIPEPSTWEDIARLRAKEARKWRKTRRRDWIFYHESNMDTYREEAARIQMDLQNQVCCRRGNTKSDWLLKNTLRSMMKTMMKPH